MNIVVLPQAADEFEDAAAHYADKQPGLGQRFRDEVDRHIRWIAQHAEIPRTNTFQRETPIAYDNPATASQRWPVIVV